MADFFNRIGRKQTFKPVAKYTVAKIALKNFECKCAAKEKGGFMSLDLCLEADSTLTISTLSKALANAGAWEIEVAGNGLYAEFTSGLKLSTNDVLDDPTIYAENTMGIAFLVAVRCAIRIKGPEPEGESAMEDLDKIAQSISQSCSAFFLISFQFEQTLYWRDSTGLHRP